MLRKSSVERYLTAAVVIIWLVCSGAVKADSDDINLKFAGSIHGKPGLFILTGTKGAKSGSWYYHLSFDPLSDDEIKSTKFSGTYRFVDGGIELSRPGDFKMTLLREQNSQPGVVQYSSGQDLLYRWSRAPKAKQIKAPSYALCNEDEGCYMEEILVVCTSAHACEDAIKSLSLKGTKHEEHGHMGDCGSYDEHLKYYEVETPMGQERYFVEALRKSRAVKSACRVAYTAGGTDPKQIEATSVSIYGGPERNQWALKDMLEKFFAKQYSINMIEISVPFDTSARVRVGGRSEEFCRHASGKWEQYELEVKVGKAHEDRDEYAVEISITDAYFGVALAIGQIPLTERLQRLDSNRERDMKIMTDCRDLILTQLGVFLRAFTVGYQPVFPEPDYSKVALPGAN